MPYVQRDEDHVILGLYSNLQEGYAEEWLDDDHPEVISFRSPPGKALAPLTARQLRLGLIANGITLGSVDATIAEMADEQDRAVASVEWEYASEFERSHPLIEQVGSALGLSPEQIDDMWEQALAL